MHRSISTLGCHPRTLAIISVKTEGSSSTQFIIPNTIPTTGWWSLSIPTLSSTRLWPSWAALCCWTSRTPHSSPWPDPVRRDAGQVTGCPEESQKPPRRRGLPRCAGKCNRKVRYCGRRVWFCKVSDPKSIPYLLFNRSRVSKILDEGGKSGDGDEKDEAHRLMNLATQLRRFNDRMIQVERAFIYSYGLPDDARSVTWSSRPTCLTRMAVPVSLESATCSSTSRGQETGKKWSARYRWRPRLCCPPWMCSLWRTQRSRKRLNFCSHNWALLLFRGNDYSVGRLVGGNLKTKHSIRILISFSLRIQPSPVGRLRFQTISFSLVFLFLFNPFTPKLKNVHSPNLWKRNVWREVVRIGGIIIFHPSKL